MKLTAMMAMAAGGVLLALGMAAGTGTTRPADGGVEVAQVIASPQGDRNWFYVTATIDEAGKLMYLVGRSYTLVEDAATGKELARINNSWGNGVALVPELGRGFISTGQWGLIVFDLKTHQELGRMPSQSGLGGMIYDSASKRLLAIKANRDAVFVIAPDLEPKTGKPEKEIEFDGVIRDMVSDEKGMVYVTVGRSDKMEEHVAVLDTREMKIMANWPIPLGVGNASGISMDRVRSRLFIACNGRLLVMSATDGHGMAQLPVGTVPGGYAGSGTTAYSEGRVFASCGDGTLSVVGQDGEGKFEVQQALAGVNGVRAMAVHPVTGAVYVPTEDREQKQLPAGFKVLVVGKKK